MYFFFFKQKTAYEMRISDWSSDVCSSDLGFLVIDDQHGCTGNSAVMLRSERRSFLFGFGDEDIAVVIEPSRNPVPPPELARNAPRLDILHPVEESLFPRSEEHTSELQSLMRNSYAVFCLTHKKTQTNKQNITYPLLHV